MSKILIIEDEVAIADLEKDYLELSGFDVQIEYAGDKGLTRALKEDFDLIVLDPALAQRGFFREQQRDCPGRDGKRRTIVRSWS